MQTYEKEMRKCFELALKARGKTSPNPMVGCVVLDKNGKEISTGFHAKCGQNHAERDALLKLKNGEEEGGTIIVSLEPCSHFGKTPPCTDLIIERKLKRVVFALKDINPKVDGVKKLEEAGIEVISGVLEDEARELNEVFIKNMQEKKCFVAIKTATTLDGKIATKNGSSKWITSASAREKVKEIRDTYDALMTTSNTVISDNPIMDVPFKIVLDRELKTPQNSKIYQKGKIFIAIDEKLTPTAFAENIEFIKCPIKNNKIDLEFLFAKLFEQEIMSVLVEAGGKLNGDVVSHGLADKIYHFIAPKILCDNSGRSCFDGESVSDINEAKNFQIKAVENFSPDILLTLIPTKK